MYDEKEDGTISGRTVVNKNRVWQPGTWTKNGKGFRIFVPDYSAQNGTNGGAR